MVLVVKLGVQYFLSRINDNRLKSYSYSSLPEKIRELFTLDEFNNTAQYTLEKSKFSLIASFFYTCFIILLLLPPFPAFYYQLFSNQLWQQVMFLISVVVMESIWSAGVGFIFQFFIEEKYGFNKSSKALWFKDTFISFFINIILMSLVFSVFIYFSNNVANWWLWSFFFLMAFMIFMFVIGPYVISPLFNKFTELNDNKLKEELMSLAKKSNFNAKTILVMDGSRRSKHSNAYFTGFGKFRRIVLYDTLIEQLSVDELKAVLAHEIGHYKRGHIPKTIVVLTIVLFFGFFGLSFLQNSNGVFTSLGFDISSAGKIAPLLFFFMLTGDSLLYFINPLFNKMTRKFEYEADAFAREAIGDGGSMISALGKLTTKNMSNPVPHPIYSGFYYSHPTFLERSKAILTP